MAPKQKLGSAKRRGGALLVAALMLAGCASFPQQRVLATPTAFVTFDARGETRAFAAGLADPASRRAVTPDDPVRIASVSKLVVAIGVMRLAEAGTLDLDADVSLYVGWRVRNPAFPGTPVTLRLLLSHRSSIADGIDYALPLGERLEDALADPKAWDAEHPPGAFFRYANLNLPVVASVMEAATGERFDRLMRRLVLAPLRLDACYNWDACDDGTVARAIELSDAAGHPLRDDLHGVRPACPVLPARDGSCDLTRWRPGENGALFAPQGGLRISPRGLATIGRLLLGGGVVDGVRLLSRQSVAALLTPLWRYDGANGDTEHGLYCAYGLATETLASRGPGCRDDLFGDGVPRVGHAGEAYGLRSGLWIDTASGTGIAFYATGVPDGEVGRRTAFTAAEEQLAARGRRRGDGP